MATIKCFSCATFDPTKTGYFCEACFKARHPWHRVPHIFTDIEKDENIEHTLRVAHRRAEAMRYEKEGQELLARVRAQKAILKNMTRKDFKLEDSMNVTGRKTYKVVNKMRDLKNQLRQEFLANERNNNQILVVSDPAMEELAANTIKRYLMGYHVRKLVSVMYVDKFIKVWNINYGRGESFIN
jgi:putative ribosome biogenesis GTPase RsgA